MNNVIGHIKGMGKALEGRDKIITWLAEEKLYGYWHWYISEDREIYSDKFWQTFGYDPDEMPKTPAAWMGIITPRSKEQAIKMFNEHVNSKGKHPYDGMQEYYHRDGRIIKIRCFGQVYRWDGDEPEAMFGFHDKV